MVIGFYLITIGFIVLLAAAIPYIIYLFGIRFGKKNQEIDISDNVELPNISIVICAYNEELTIRKKIQSIDKCSYPNDKIETIIVVDCSDDNTESTAKDELSKYDFSWKVSVNKVRSGKNGSLNNGIRLASNEIIIDTDADVIWDDYAVEHLVRRIITSDDIAVVSGDLQPYEKGERLASMEKTYRSFFGRMSEWESSNDATYIINGCLLAIRKSIINEITSSIGPDDANIAFVAIRKGYKIIYDASAKVYEDIPDKMKKQYSQKARRAKGIIQATLANRDLLKMKRPFSKFFYPLRIYMYVYTPTFFIAGSLILIIGMILAAPILLLILAIISILITLFWKGNLMTSFVINQIYLAAGLYSRRKDAVIWESTSKKSGEN